MYDDSEDPSELDEEWEYSIGWGGVCICDHEPDDHGWGSCDEEDCPCEAGWEE